MHTVSLHRWWQALWSWGHQTESMVSLSEAKYTACSDEKKECMALLRATVGALGRGATQEANTRWKNLVTVAAVNDLSVGAMLGPDSSDVSLLEELLERRDWKAVRFFWSRIEDGMYARGRLKKTAQGLFTIKEGKNDGLSLYFPATGGMYCGEMSSGRMHGYGQMYYALGDVFEGSWVQGRWHGAGTFRSLGQKSNTISGQFVAGRLRSDLRDARSQETSQ